MDVEKLIKQLRSAAKLEAYYNSEYNGLYNQTADALEKLQAENAYMRELLHRYCSCKVCANAAEPYGLHCKFGGCNGGGNGLVKEDCWELRVRKEEKHPHERTAH